MLYDGNGGVTYNTTTLSGTIPATCGTSRRRRRELPGERNSKRQSRRHGARRREQQRRASSSRTRARSPRPTVRRTGMTSVDIGVSEATSNRRSAIRCSCDSRNEYMDRAGRFVVRRVQRRRRTPVGNTISFSGRTADRSGAAGRLRGPALRDAARRSNGGTLTTTFTWTSDTPALATIDAERRHSRARRRHRDVPRDGGGQHDGHVLRCRSRVAVASTTAQYGGNTEFGDPTDADPSDDFIIRRPEYTTSYNKNRGTPNWVATISTPRTSAPTSIAATASRSIRRCRRASRTTRRPTTRAPARFAGFGIDRGHLARSFDRTSGTLDNAITFYSRTSFRRPPT